MQVLCDKFSISYQENEWARFRDGKGLWIKLDSSWTLDNSVIPVKYQIDANSSDYKWLQKGESEVARSCLTLCNPMDCSLPGSSIHGISQARIMQWVAISFSRGSSWPRDQTRVSCIAGRLFTVWATREGLYFANSTTKPNGKGCRFIILLQERSEELGPVIQVAQKASIIERSQS